MSSLKAKASKIIERRKSVRKAEYEARKSEIFARLPRVGEIERRLDQTGINLINMVLDGSCEPDEAVNKIMLENRIANDEKRRLLSENGFSPDALDNKPLCAKCGDTGFFEGEICSCVRAELSRELLSEANLTGKQPEQTFDAFRFDYYSPVPDTNLGISPLENIRSVFALCKSYAENFETEKRNLFFTGGCGLGKTFLSSAIVNALVGKGVDVIYVSANSLFPILEDLHFNREVSEQNQYLVRRVFDSELLILDDLGAEFVTQFTSSELFRIINNRLLDERNTVISTNMDLGELRSKYSERIYSRIAGSFEIVAFFGEDIRRKKKMEES